jgi:hypothetical protein
MPNNFFSDVSKNFNKSGKSGISDKSCVTKIQTRQNIHALENQKRSQQT